MLLWCALALADPDATIVVEAPVRAPEQTSAVVTTVRIDDRLSGADDVASVVDVAPGTSVKRLGGLGDASGVSIRGGGLRQTLVLLDGVPLNPDGGATVNLTELPLSAFGAVDVYRGGVPAELGPNAMGGVVDLHSRDTPGGSVQAALGSLGTARVGAGYGGATARVRGLVIADMLRSDGDFLWFDDAATRFNIEDDAERVRQNNDMQQGAVHATGTVTFGRRALTGLQSVTASEEGVPGPAGGLTDSVRFAVARSLTSVQWTDRRDAGSTVVRAWGSVREERLDDALGEIGLTAEQTRDRAASAGVRAVQSWVVRDDLSGSLVLDGRLDTYRAQDVLTDTVSDTQRRGVVRASAAGHVRPGRIAIDGVLEGVWLRTATGDRVEPTPSLGIRVPVSERVALKARIQRSLRPPDLLELYGNRGAIVGNAELTPEVGVQIDTSLVATWESGSAELTPFVVRRSDGIVYIQNAQRTASPVNLESTTVAGIEAYASSEWSWGFARGSAAFMHSDNGSPLPAYAGKQLPRTPAVRVESQVGLTRGPWRLGHTMSVQSTSYLDAANLQPSPSRMLHSAFVRASLLDGLTVELGVQNIGDERIGRVDRNPLDRSDDTRVQTALTDFTAYPLAGRTALVSVRWTP